MLLFDLGGVLVDFSGVRDIAKLLPTPASREEIIERWSHCPDSYAFGVGEIGAEEFAQRFVRHWEIALPPDQFLREFQTWVRGFLPGAKDLLESLRPRFRLGALSNSNGPGLLRGGMDWRDGRGRDTRRHLAIRAQ